MTTRNERRARETRCALLVFIAALDDTALPVIGEWLLELGAALLDDAEIPDGADMVRALRGELETSADEEVAALAQRLASTTRES